MLAMTCLSCLLQHFPEYFSRMQLVCINIIKNGFYIKARPCTSGLLFSRTVAVFEMSVSVVSTVDI